MKERPILFKDDMVRAILDDRKTQTRRIIKPQPESMGIGEWFWNDWRWQDHPGKKIKGLDEDCPYGQPGDRLWVREAHAFVPTTAYRCSTGIYQQINPSDDYEACVYKENFDRSRGFPWRPSIYMPRWASRITLEIINVRVERLQDISVADAIAEGIPRGCPANPDGIEQREYHALWDQINGTGSWDANPWVWVVEFKRAALASAKGAE